MAASCILLPRWGTGTPLGHKYPVGACPLARGGTGSLRLEFFLRKPPDKTFKSNQRKVEPQKQKGLLPFCLAIRPCLFSRLNKNCSLATISLTYTPRLDFFQNLGEFHFEVHHGESDIMPHRVPDS